MRIMEGERVVWQGRPAWRAVARDVLHMRWVAAYVMGLVIWSFASDRDAGLTVADTLFSAIPIFLLGTAVLLMGMGFAVGCARTTTYVVTADRLLMRYGVALPATMSIPLRKVAGVAVRTASDGTADIALTLKPGARVTILRMWPHVRPRRLGRSQPMLRGVPGGVAVAALLSQTVAAVSPGVLHGAPAQPGPRTLPEPILSPAGD